jgi:hypothetical protein
MAAGKFIHRAALSAAGYLYLARLAAGLTERRVMVFVAAVSTRLA